MFFGLPPAPPLAEKVALSQPKDQRALSEAATHETPEISYTLVEDTLRLEGGRLLLRFLRQPKIKINTKIQECEVLGWGIKMPIEQAGSIPQALSRRFLELFSKADLNCLNDEETDFWVNIIDHISFSDFSIQRAAPHYVEGKFIVSGNRRYVEWHEGTKQPVESTIAHGLTDLRHGDNFGSYVKFGKDNQILSIERISLLQEET